ncbi:MAG: glycosyltransferase family 39 protein [Prolixibacteraceae bacterium]|nr:glycosyltransferase family 39 protein [Prolixibacteraceae bacterium]
MISFLKKLTTNELLIFILIFVFATFFYLFNIGFSDLWSDEIYTKAMLEGSLSDFYRKFVNDLHPPLYYLGLRLFTALFGLNPITLRLFSVLGVLSTLLLGYFTGQRVFGKQGALYFCLMLISVPMLAVYSHQARMYTWAAFSVTGVFFYSYLFIKTQKKYDLVLLFIFTVVAMYIHYYSMVAAFVANMYVLFHLLRTKNKKWLQHLLSLLCTALLFLPWLFMFVVQVKRVQHAFWVPAVSFTTVFHCFGIPFTEQFWTTGYSISLVILNYGLIIFTFFNSSRKPFSEYRLALWLSMIIFSGTLIVVMIISLFSQSILFSRYVVAIVVMLVVPLTVLFVQMKLKWLKMLLISVILFLALRISVSAFYFSYGPYKQTIEYISTAYPEIRKILHITEVTAGPLLEYTGNSGLKHYWLKAEMSNVDAFPEVQQFNRPGEFLEPGEVFCAVRFHNLELNIENLELVLSESELVKKDTIRDNKVNDGIFIQLYLLKYSGVSE